MPKQGLPHSCRLHLKRDFERVILGGIKLKGNGLIVWYVVRNDNRPSRFAVVVSRKLGPAVVRNRIKRLLREVFRLNRKNWADGIDIIVSPRDSEKLSNLHAVQEALKSISGQTALLKPLSAPNESGEN
ncbi:ribonuclease P protein component [Candidatus Avelusimicrobium luingense]|uniref:ribonuclease P protein component n=1 Tax=Candidatus Avelusimicrobium luingense TaxID=3416211 RepID=UPI003D11086A